MLDAGGAQGPFSHYTAHSDDPGDVRLAGRSAAALIDVVTGTSGRDLSDGRDNMYDHLMDQLDDRNPEIVLSLGRVASGYLSDFAGPSPLGTDGTTRWSERGDEVVIVDADKSRFLNLVATNGEAMDRLSYDAGAFTQGNLRAALNAGDPVYEQMAAGSAGTLDGLLHAARMCPRRRTHRPTTPTPASRSRSTTTSARS